MGYDKNKLLKVCSVQDVAIALMRLGFTTVFIFERFIEKPFFISRRTFDTYMSLNAQNLLFEQYGIEWEAVKEEYRPESATAFLKNLRAKTDVLAVSEIPPSEAKALARRHASRSPELQEKNIQKIRPS